MFNKDSKTTRPAPKAPVRTRKNVTVDTLSGEAISAICNAQPVVMCVDSHMARFSQPY